MKYFPTVFRHPTLTELPLFGSHWSNHRLWELYGEAIQGSLLSYSMQLIDIVYVLSISCSAFIFPDGVRPLLQTIMKSIQNNCWLFDRKIKRSAYFVRSVQSPVEGKTNGEHSGPDMAAGGIDGALLTVPPVAKARSRYLISRPVFRLVKAYENKAHSYFTNIHKCLYFHCKFSYGRYRFYVLRCSISFNIAVVNSTFRLFSFR